VKELLVTGACSPASSPAAKQTPFRIKVLDEASSSTGHFNLSAHKFFLKARFNMSRRSTPVFAFERLAIGDRDSMPVVPRSQHSRNLAASQQVSLGQAVASSSTRPSTRQQRRARATSTNSGNTGSSNDGDSGDDSTAGEDGVETRVIVLKILSAFDPELLMPSELTGPLGRQVR